jgi:D-glycero-D-manno-heptose 1,7-bisphosphate phosphatase
MPEGAVFLDRDGTVIEDVAYLRSPDCVRLLPGVVPALRRLRAAGFPLVLVSNQSGIGRGIIAPEDARAVHQRFVEVLAEAGLFFDDVRYCPHRPDEACRCRKPSPAMILDAASELGVDPSASFMVGDKASDVEAGHRAGCRTILFGAAIDGVNADDVAETWDDVAGLVIGERAT